MLCNPFLYQCKMYLKVYIHGIQALLLTKWGGGEGGEIVLFCLIFKGIIFFIMAFPEFKKLYLGEGEKFITSENVQSLYR